MLPDCPHYVYPPFLIGRKAICWKCEGVFVISREAAKPICDNCIKRKKPLENKEDLQKFFSILKENEDGRGLED